MTNVTPLHRHTGKEHSIVALIALRGAMLGLDEIPARALAQTPCVDKETGEPIAAWEFLRRQRNLITRQMQRVAEVETGDRRMGA